MTKRYCDNCRNTIDETEDFCSSCLMPVEMMDRWPMHPWPSNTAECTSCHHIWATDCLPFKCPKCGGNSIYTTISNGCVPQGDPVGEALVAHEKALDTQVGGSHYKDMVIQPAEFNQKNKIPYCEANAIKYICRHRGKNGKEDIDKAIHYLEMLKEMEYGD